MTFFMARQEKPSKQPAPRLSQHKDGLSVDTLYKIQKRKQMKEEVNASTTWASRAVAQANHIETQRGIWWKRKARGSTINTWQTRKKSGLEQKHERTLSDMTRKQGHKYGSTEWSPSREYNLAVGLWDSCLYCITLRAMLVGDSFSGRVV